MAVYAQGSRGFPGGTLALLPVTDDFRPRCIPGSWVVQANYRRSFLHDRDYRDVPGRNTLKNSRSKMPKYSFAE